MNRSKPPVQWDSWRPFYLSRKVSPTQFRGPRPAPRGQFASAASCSFPLRRLPKRPLMRSTRVSYSWISSPAS